jgi:hypothetical protein
VSFLEGWHFSRIAAVQYSDRTNAVRLIRSPLLEGRRVCRIENEPALLFLLELNVLQITILNFDTVALTEGTSSSAFVSCLVLVLWASAGAFLFMILLRSHGLRRDKCRNVDKGCEGENSQRSHDGPSSHGVGYHHTMIRVAASSPPHASLRYSSASDLFVGS